MHWYEWAFSGIGVLVLSLVANPLISRRRFPEAHRAGSSCDGLVETSPTPKEILQEIHASLPIDQDHAGKKYQDLPVVWKLKLGSIKKNFEGTKWVVGASTNTKPWEQGYAVIFYMSELPPELASATALSLLLVAGTIKEVGVSEIWLRENPDVRVIERV